MSENQKQLNSQLHFLYKHLTTIQESLTDLGYVYGQKNESSTKAITALRTTNNNQSEPCATEFLLTELSNISQVTFIKALIEIRKTINRLEEKENN